MTPMRPVSTYSIIAQNAGEKDDLETPGSGVALLDYDMTAGLIFISLTASTFPALKGQGSPAAAMLLHNNMTEH